MYNFVGNNNFSPWTGFNIFSFFLPAFIGFIVFELVLKAIALWRSARNGQKGWFVALLILNTLGILPIVYLLLFQKKGKHA